MDTNETINPPEKLPGDAQSVRAHRTAAEKRGPVGVALVTVSDTRTPDTDANGPYLKSVLETAGHFAASYVIIRDEPADVETVLQNAVRDTKTQVVLFNGGTGIASRDTTFDVLSRRLEKTLPGFGEIFRMLSYEQVGAAAMLSRACAGVYQKKLVVCLPGSHAAVRLAWEKLLGPELSHLAWEVAR